MIILALHNYATIPCAQPIIILLLCCIIKICIWEICGSICFVILYKIPSSRIQQLRRRDGRWARRRSLASAALFFVRVAFFFFGHNWAWGLFDIPACRPHRSAIAWIGCICRRLKEYRFHDTFSRVTGRAIRTLWVRVSVGTTEVTVKTFGMSFEQGWLVIDHFGGSKRCDLELLLGRIDIIWLHCFFSSLLCCLWADRKLQCICSPRSFAWWCLGLGVHAIRKLCLSRHLRICRCCPLFKTRRHLCQFSLPYLRIMLQGLLQSLEATRYLLLHRV